MAKIGSLIIDIAGTSLTPEDKNILEHPLIGGIIFFSRNYESREQLSQLITQIRQSRQKPLLLLVDQEGGRVQRFKEGFAALPPMAEYGALYEQDPFKAAQQAKQHAKQLASELLAVGIDMTLAPVLDLNRGLNTVIGDRAFHADPIVASTLAKAFLRGLNEAGMAGCGKHFPGHGGVKADSHTSMPTDDRSFAELSETDLIPFIELINAGISAIMAAHITFPKVDLQPAGFSRIWLRDILREQLGFRGTIFTDDLNMAGAAISVNYADRIKAARKAGCDFALLCNNREGVIQAIQELSEKETQVEQAKWYTLLNHASRITIS